MCVDPTSGASKIAAIISANITKTSGKRRVTGCGVMTRSLPRAADGEGRRLRRLDAVERGDLFLGEDGCRRSLGEHLPGAKQHELAAEPGGKLHVVRREHD